MDCRIYASTEKSLSRSHKVNEDRYMFSEYAFMEDKKIRLLVVCDGMGGLQDGDKAASNATRGFINSFYREVSERYMNAAMDGFSVAYHAEEVGAIMAKAIQCANEEVLKGADPFAGRTGSTISAVCVCGEFAVIANVGDSPVYFYRKNKNELKLVSTLQTLAEANVRKGIYERYSSEYYQDEYKITSSLGKLSNLKESEICVSYIGQLNAGDAFLAGSDGAFGRVSEQEIVELLQFRPKDEEGFIISRLFALGRMDGDDDQTAILYVVVEEEK